MAIAAQRSFTIFRPGGMKVIAGALILEPGLTENDFRELAEAGLTIIGEVGLGGVKDGPTGRQMVAWARANGMTSMTHTGGPSIPGSGRIGADVVIEVDADVVAHVNGGPTALPFDELTRLLPRKANSRIGDRAQRQPASRPPCAGARKKARRACPRAPGTDGPAGSGVQPLGIIRMITMLASLGDVLRGPFCFATGNTPVCAASLDRGIVEAGRAADLVFMDRAAGGAGEGPP